MPDGLYERDALAWAEQQAGLLRRLAAGEAVEGLVDWANVIEEVGDVGLAELAACQGLLRKAMVGLLRLRAGPGSEGAGQWREEAGLSLDDAARRFTPSMRERIDLDDLYADALYIVDVGSAGGGMSALPKPRPFGLDELLAGDVGALVAKMGGR